MAKNKAVRTPQEERGKGRERENLTSGQPDGAEEGGKRLHYCTCTVRTGPDRQRAELRV